MLLCHVDLNICLRLPRFNKALVDKEAYPGLADKYIKLLEVKKSVSKS